MVYLLHRVSFVPLIKLLFTTLLTIGTLSTPALAVNEIAPNTTLTSISVPADYTNAHNIQLQLISDEELARGGLLQRLRSGFAMRELDSPLVAKYERWYARRPEYMNRMMDRASLYLYYITSEVERRGMPSEIALLPMIESAFKPDAYSHSNAAGIWQFMPATGRHFGLRQNWWYDGRRDIIGATNGALNYLGKLHTLFGDWQLALAAYNWGEGAVQRAQRKNRRKGLPTDYSSLKLPHETRNYLPKLLAIKNIVADPSRFGLALHDIPNEPYFVAVPTTGHIDVELITQLANISAKDFTALNPAHNRPVILQDNCDFILLPTDKAKLFQRNLENYNKPLVSWQAYHARKGERLDLLAPRFGLSVKELMTVNSLTSRKRLRHGQTLIVPLNEKSRDKETAFQAFNMHLLIAPRYNNRHHLVRRGETLGLIAHRYHISVASLIRINGGTSRIRVGQKISLSRSSAQRHRRAPRYDNRHHLVRRGETLGLIAHRYHISVASLIRINGGTNRIRAGQKISLSRSSAHRHRRAPRYNNRHHLVRRGETLGLIAHRYHISIASLIRINGGTSRIRAGQKISLSRSSAHRHRRAKHRKRHISHRNTRKHTASGSTRKPINLAYRNK
ncbi:MAG: LysM peptidoglycan-binding domain-containing protein [Gallionella sp.]